MCKERQYQERAYPVDAPNILNYEGKAQYSPIKFVFLCKVFRISPKPVFGSRSYEKVWPSWLIM